MLNFISKQLSLFFFLAFALVITLFLLFVGFHIVLLLIIFLWVIFYFSFIRRMFINFNVAKSLVSIFLLFLVIISISLLLVVKLTVKPVTSSMGVKLTKEQCAPLLQEYDGDVLQINGDGLVGSISIKINPEDCKSEVRYLFLANTQLPANEDAKNNMPYPYNYIASLRDVDETERADNGIGALSAVYQNQGVLADSFISSIELSEFYRIPNDPGLGSSDWFYNSYSREFYMSHERYEELLQPKVFEIIDGQPFIEIETIDEGGFSTSINHERAAVEGQIVRSFDITISAN